MSRFFILILFVILLSLYDYTPVLAESLRNSMLFKVTVIEKGKEIEWEYVNPNEYELETGNKVIKNEKAKQEIEELFNKLAISKTKNVNEMLTILKEDGYENIERLDIRWITADDQLYTWVWTKKK